MLPYKQIESRLQAAAREVLPDADVTSVLVRPCPDPKFGDYQSNALMALAKVRKMNPRQLATDVVARLEVAEWCEKVEIAGAGFLNFRLRPAALDASLQSAARGEHLFFAKAAQPRTIVVDFSSPNVAKPMHVGHIRSTGIGDALQRTLRLLGHNVITDNHIGDWGTQFGMLILAWKGAEYYDDFPAKASDPIEALENLYKQMAAACKGDEAALKHFADRLSKKFGHNFTITTSETSANYALEKARLELVNLQAGDPENVAIWKEMTKLSQKQFETIYGRLGVKFDHTLGESFYNPWLNDVVADLLKRGIAKESDGAVAVFSDGTLPPKEDPFLVNRDGEWIPDPALIRKSDGGFNYTTTDLATLDYRLKTWSPQEILYVVDDRQGPHFKKLFLVFGRWQPEALKTVKLVHIGFGKIMGDDGKPFKTRSGDTVKLGDLLDEAEERCLRLVTEKNPDLSEARCREIARVVGLAAVKYADLLPNRQSDYVFNWDKMLAFTGNTAPYLLYAYSRIKSIFRKLDPGARVCDPQHVASKTEPGGHVDANEFKISHPEVIHLVAPEELVLAKHLLNFGLALEGMADEYRPNFLCSYLYELAGKFTSFYENCPVLKAEDTATRDSRLALCDLTARVLKQGLAALGIETIEQM